MNAIELANIMIFNYYIIFETEKDDLNYSPCIINTDKDYYRKTYHVWDYEINKIIPAIWFVLHLPRVGFDVTNMDIELILKSHDEPHNIVPLPYNHNWDMSKKMILQMMIKNPTLIICDDSIYDDLIESNILEDSILGILKVSELKSEFIYNYWDILGKHINTNYKESTKCIVDKEFRLTNESERTILPLIPFANQFGVVNKIINDIKKFTMHKKCNEFCLGMRQRIIELAYELSDREQDLKDNIRKSIDENINFQGAPLIMTMPGVPAVQRNRMGTMKSIPNNEKQIINIIGYHRAIAKNGMYCEVECISDQLFAQLDKLEQHCKSSKRSNKFVWETIKKIGDLLNGVLDKDLLKYSSQITVFSDFPIGIAVLSGCTAPLCCFKSIIYRPLTPLIESFKYEMGKVGQVYLGEKCKVLILECVKKTDKIRGDCDALSNMLKEMIINEDNMTINYYDEVNSSSKIKNILNKNRDADILLISAHGKYEGSNLASLVIWDEIWMADDNDLWVPPVVLLSACHVNPRGRGAVNVGDSFIKAGAKAVLGTLVPVDVRRNATLITRLFTDIIQVRNGWSDMRTLDEIWNHIVSTNAVHEILSSSEKLEIWANTVNSTGTFPQAEFKNNYSIGRLKGSSIYKDTEKILRELAYRDGLGEFFDAVMNSTGYFPESIFYQFMGYPENVFIRNDVFKAYNESL